MPKNRDAFSPADLHHYERLRAELEVLELKRTVLGHEMATHESKHQAVVQQLNQDARALNAQRELAKQKIKKLEAELAKRYQIDFSQIGYDDVTGKIHRF